MRWFPVIVFIAVASCQGVACPSDAGDPCNPRQFDCPATYYCSLAEVCTRACADSSECWVKVENGCRYTYLPGQRLPDGGAFQEMATEDGYCPNTKSMACVDGYCQRCPEGGCDYDLYGPSPFKGNRDRGPE